MMEGPWRAPLLTARDPRPDEVQPPRLGLGGAAHGVFVVAVAAVHDHVAVVEVLGEARDHGIDGCTGLDHHDDPSRRFQGRDQILDGVGADDAGAGCRALQELGGPFGGAVVHDHAESVVGHVESQVLAHDGQADEPYVGVARGVLRFDVPRLTVARRHPAGSVVLSSHAENRASRSCPLTSSATATKSAVVALPPAKRAA
jgi:hypothetical protein